MRQLLYVSSSVAGHPADLQTILDQSRRNNPVDGVTGLLWSDGKRFLQVLEGAEETVETTFQRIRADPRHRAVVVLSDRMIGEREFGDWAMAHRSKDEPADVFDGRIDTLLAGTSDSVRGTFTGLIAVRR